MLHYIEGQVGMKLWLKRYQVMSICLSLMIVTLAFVIGSDGEHKEILMVLAFFLGAVLYFLGSVREWKRNRMTSCVLEGLLAVCMLAGSVMSLLWLVS